MDNIVWIWLAAAVIFLIIELVTPTLVFVCFVAASLVSAIFAYFAPESYYWQIGIFVLIGTILIPVTRPFARRITQGGSDQKANTDALIGQVGLVTKAIDSDLGGQVRIEGEIWVANARESIAVNEKVRIISVSGTKVLVEKLS